MRTCQPSRKGTKTWTPGSTPSISGSGAGVLGEGQGHEVLESTVGARASSESGETITTELCGRNVANQRWRR